MKKLNIKGIHPIRDYKICSCWCDDHLSFKEIGEKFNLTERRVRQILMLNHAFKPLDKEWEKKKRIQKLQRAIKDAPDSKKDVADLIDQLRRELEGDKPNINIENHTHYTTIKELVENANTTRNNRLPERVEG